MAERLVSLISGGGSTMQHIGRAIENNEIPGLEFAGVIASDETTAATGIQRALELGVPVFLCNPERFRGDDGQIDRYGFGQELIRDIKKVGGTVVTQNGWLPWTPDNVIEEFEDAIYNQHPGPLPETKNLHGMQPHATMLDFVRKTGRNEGTEVVAHRVVSGMDEGALVGVRDVAIEHTDWPKRLQKRALPVEHQLQVDVLNDHVKGQIQEMAQEYHFRRDGENKLLLASRKHARRRYPNG